MTPDEFAVPNYRIPKVLGILNIVFASGLLLCGLCFASSIAVWPALGSLIQEAQKKEQAKTQAALKALDEEEKAAKDEDAKEEIRDRRSILQAQSKSTVMASSVGMESMGLDDPKVLAFYWVDLGTGIALNLLMLVSGIGLVLFKPWGRSLGLGTAGAKILRLVLVYGYFALAIVPTLSLKQGKALVTMIQVQQQAAGRPAGAAPSVEQLVRTYTITYTVSAVVMIVAGVMYPAISLWLLSRPGARAACSGGKSPREPNDRW
jgi:hypothetical protein